MGRRPKLTEKEWAEIGKRLLADEKGRALAREFGVSEAAIRKRFSAQNKQIKDVANQLVSAEAAFKALPVSAQISARTLADDLRSISENLASAANYGAMTARRLSGMAHQQTGKIGETAIEECTDTLQGIAVLTKMANASSEIGVNLLRANKEAIDDLTKSEGKQAPSGLEHFYGSSAS